MYYPYAAIRNIETLKKTLLVFDHIYLIYPTQYYKGLGIEPSSFQGHFSESHYYLDELMDRDIFRIISPGDTVAEDKYRDFMLKELEKDQRDPKFLNEKSRQGWALFVEKVPEPILQYPEFRPFRDGGAIRLPFVEGESIMISHAICGWWAKAKRGELISPITDEPIHQKLLDYRLERAIKTAEPSIQNDVSPTYLRRAIDFYLPEPPNEIEHILTARRENSTTLRRIRESIKSIASIIENAAIRKSLTDNFDSDITRLNEELMTAYRELGKEYSMQGTVIRTDIMDRYSPVIGGFSGTAIGTRISLLPSLGVGLLSSENTTLAREAYSDIEKLRNPVIGYRVEAT